MPQPSIFISYSHQDELWKDRLVQQLGVLEGEGLFTVWHDRKIGLGQDWFPEIERAIQAARVAILLVSSDFLTSGFIKQKEIPEFLRRRQEEGLMVVPVIVRPCAWKKVKWLADINARPTDGKPLTSLDWETELAQLVDDIDTHLQSTPAPPEETFLETGNAKTKLRTIDSDREKTEALVHQFKWRYQVALSFAGEQRPFVNRIAAILAAALGQDQVFYDRFHEAELARPNLDLYLQSVYSEQSKLVVVFLGIDYEHKEWPGLEWRSVRDLVKRRSASQVMLVRLDDAPISGILGIDGFIEAQGRSPQQIADLILRRLSGSIRTLQDKIVDGSFLELYRRAMNPLFSSWDLGNVGVTQTGGAGAPLEARLDDMYLPLRLAVGFDLRKTEEGAAISPEDLLQREKPLTIRGAAGSGKTTWVRWTFRRLLDHPDAFPMMLILRDLAIPWSRKDLQGKERSLDHFLEDWVAEQLGRDCREELRQQIAAKPGPRPVLLVDGWDEIGPLGKELREKLLGLKQRYPRLLIVATSRPYGDGQPSHSEGFDLMDIQPFSDEEIQKLATRFFTRCYREEPKKAEQEAKRFRRSLERAPEPQALARTALLLTMMLLIARSRPLPDKRHLLYQACIENLLTALPDRKAEEGARILHHQWRPDDSEARLRVVAELAFRLQEGADPKLGWQDSGLPIVKRWEDMASLLPREIPERRRSEFLAWLAETAGLLTDRTDGTLAFTHLSFQEYLAAWHLNATVEGEGRVEAFKNRSKEPAWWETLRLWAAFLERNSPAWLGPVFAELSRIGAPVLPLVGGLLADGFGAEEQFQGWLSHLGQRLPWLWPVRLEACARAWAASRQEERRGELVRFLTTTAPDLSWLGWLRYRDFSELAALEPELPQPRKKITRAAIQQLLDEGQFSEPVSVAASRLLSGGPPLWPNSLPHLGLLQLWSSHRKLAGAQLQTALACGAGREDLCPLASRLLLNSDPEDLDLALDGARYLAREWTSFLEPDKAHLSGLFRDLARELARYWARSWARDLGRHWVRDGARHWARNLGGYKHPKGPLNWARSWATAGTEFVPPILARTLGVSPKAQWLEDFAGIDGMSFGRLAARSFLPISSVKGPEAALLSPACKLSLHPDSDPTPFQEALVRYAPDLDPLWPALARHVARLATPEDRALLEDLAQNPERREPPLRWGLQFIVRGDVMLEDGTIITLDELADEAGVPRLPFLDEMPDELEVDWEENEDVPEAK
jgi:TIR domain/NACHT domain